MSAETASDDTLIGKVVQGRFEVQRRLAAGGMGVVYLAVQQPLGRPVAFKVLELAQGSVDQSFQQRFFLEASAAAKLAHPNTIVVHDYGRTEGGQYFIAMEYLDGGALADRLEQGPLPPSEAIHVGLQIASSLRDAHQQGLVHRDLKPGNVMFAPRGGDPLFVKVLDFGLVKMVGEGEGEGNLGLTQSGMMMGSPRYMAPEQVRAQAVDARTDIYSFGAVLYHMVAGGPPFHAGSAFEAMQHHVYTPAPPLRQMWAGCPASPELEAVILRCLEKQPQDRFQSMDQVFGALRALATPDASGSGYLVHASGSYSMLDSNERVPPPQFSSSSTSSSPSSTSTDEGVSSSGMRSTRARTAPLEPVPAPPPSGSAPLSGSTTMARPRQTGMLAVVGFLGVLVLGGLAAVGIFVVPGLLERGAESPPRADTPAPAPDPAPIAVPPPVVEPPTAPTTDPAPATAVALMLRTDPAGATVRRDGEDLGDSPLPLLIPRGERWTLEVSREGYETRTVIVAGGQREVLLHLRQLQAGAPRPPRPSRPTLVPEIRPLAPAPAPAPSPPPRGRRGVYAPDLNDPWAGRR